VLSIGVVLFEDPPERLARLGRALASCRGAPFELAFTDHSFGAIRERVLAAFPHASYAHAPENRGFGAGHNRLMAAAFERGASAYVCLNPGALPHPDALVELEAELARHHNPGLIDARQFPDEHPKPYDARTHLTPWTSGCMLLVTRALHQALGGFDEGFFLYCEDVDLSWRARGQGFDVATAPEALVHHCADERGAKGPERHMLKSGAYLATKYSARRFAEQCRRRYQALAGAALEVPSPPAVSRAAKALADFDHDFTFAEPRW
jgi:GT2 family glycosyltransferase